MNLLGRTSAGMATTVTIGEWVKHLPPHLAALVEHLARHLLTDEQMRTTVDELAPLNGLVDGRALLEAAIAQETTSLRRQPAPWRWSELGGALGLSVADARARYQQQDDRPLAQLEDRFDEALAAICEEAQNDPSARESLVAAVLELVAAHCDARTRLRNLHIDHQTNQKVQEPK